MISGGGSLRRRIRSTLGALSLVGVVGIGLLLWLSVSAHTRSLEATHNFVEDERASDRITRAVLQQLAVAVAFPTAAHDEEREAFLASGTVVHNELRRYLFGTLTPEERIRLAEVREAHQRFEVQAIQAADLFARDVEEQADGALLVMARLAGEFLEGMEGFFAIRIAALDELQRNQEALQATLLRSALLLAAGLVLLSMLAAWELNRRVARPLTALAEVTERIATGSLDARVPTRGDHEFRVMAERFNRMAEGLQQREAQLTRALADVEEAQGELIAVETLGAVGRMSAGFAHEINNPLTSVLGYAELLDERLASDPPPDPEEARALLAPILKEASRARSLVESLVQVARHPEGPISAVSLRETIDAVVGLREYAFQQAGLELVVEGVPGVSVRVDSQLLHAVFLHLINNALDAMRPQGRGSLTISGTFDRAEGWVELEFIDTGPGLSQPDRIFEPFHTTKPVGEGTGLGLSLVHQFVTAAGGEIHASDAEAGGARFLIRLPPADTEAVRDVAEVRMDPSDATESATAPSVTAEPGPATVEDGPAGATVQPDPPPGDTSDPFTVLVVEDEPHLLKLQARLLARIGLRVVEASSVAEARRALAKEAVDLIVSDVRMPGESGIDLYLEVRNAHPELVERFLFVTGDATVPELDAIVQAQGEIVIRKPFRMEEYLTRIRKKIAS
ncbi:MAG: hybrid sensor histidine kinase/response regulator [Longimicrobiales bacterium]|nr:hybrid sensor histidine kinase/response regulator [Longimicrobiales bacterium]